MKNKDSKNKADPDPVSLDVDLEIDTRHGGVRVVQVTVSPWIFYTIAGFFFYGVLSFLHGLGSFLFG